MRVVALLAVCAVCLSAWTAGAVEITASVDRDVVSLGDRIILSVTVSGVARGSAPSLPSMDIFRIQDASHSTQIQIINGHPSISSQYEYALLPLKAGTATIPPITLTHEGKTYSTQPITVEVIEAGAAVSGRVPARPEQPSPMGKAMFIELSTDRSEVFLHEGVVLTFRFYNSLGLADQPAYEAPPTPGFFEKQLGEGRARNYVRVIDGRRYQVSELKSILYPYQSGDLTIGPAKLRGEFLIESPRRPRRPGSIFDMDDLFSDPFFGRFDRKSFELTSNTLKVSVRPLPTEGAPQGEVAVGRYALHVGANPGEVHAGDPVTLTMEVKGEGDLERIPPPRLSSLEGFKSYEITSSTEITGRADRIEGVKKFEQVVVPLREGAQEVPRMVFHYFDPREKRYVALSEGPIPIKVLPPKEEVAAKIVGAPDEIRKPGVELLERNIVFIKTSPGRMLNRNEIAKASPLFWIAQAFPLILVIGAAFHARHRERLRSDRGYARLHGAGRITRARLKSVRKAMEKGDRTGFYDGLVKAINMYIADRLNIPSGGLTPDIVRDALKERGVSGDMIKRLDELLGRCDYARFASAAGDRSGMEKIFMEATAILDELRRSGLQAK